MKNFIYEFNQVIKQNDSAQANILLYLDVQNDSDIFRNELSKTLFEVHDIDEDDSDIL